MKPKFDSSNRWKLVNDLEWTNDLTTEYFKGLELAYVWPWFKGLLLLAILSALKILLEWNLWALLGIGLFLIATYQHLVIFLSHGQLIYMPVMDNATFLSSTKLNANIMSMICIDGPVYNMKWVEEKHKKLMKDFPKLTYKIIQVCGDLYYKEMTHEETARRALFDMGKEGPMTEVELDEFISANLNQKLPLDGPQYRIYIQQVINAKGEKNTLMLWKSHHCLGDGVSIVALQAAFSDEFTPDYFIKTKEVPLLQQWLLRIVGFLTIPVVVMKTALSKEDKNFMTRGKRDIQGEVEVATSKVLDMREIKALCKKKKCTVNDIVISSTSATLHDYFLKNNEKPPASVQLFMPANIRFGMYKSYDEINLENKWAALPIHLPLIKSMQAGTESIRKVTAQIKSSVNQVYGSYLLTYLTTFFAPRAFPRLFLEEASRKFTIGFSNTPGPIKPYVFSDDSGNESRTLYTQYYPLATGRIGIVISCISCYNTFKVAVTADKAICKDTRWIVETISSKLEAEIELQKTLPENPPPADKKLDLKMTQ